MVNSRKKVDKVLAIDIDESMSEVSDNVGTPRSKTKVI
jgi:hypothetical protein